MLTAEAGGWLVCGRIKNASAHAERRCGYGEVQKAAVKQHSRSWLHPPVWEKNPRYKTVHPTA